MEIELHIKKFCFLLALLAGLTFMGDDTREPRHNAPELTPETVCGPETLRGGGEFYRNALHALVRGDVEGERLAAWHDARARYASYEPGTDEIVTSDTGLVSETYLDILMVSEQELNERGLLFNSSFEYIAHRRGMIVHPPGSLSPTWSAAILAHELVHAREHAEGTLPVGTMRSDDAHQDAEIRAYTVEIRLLDHAVDGAFTRFVDEMLDVRNFYPGTTAPLPDRIQPTMEEVERFSALYEPCANADEFMFRMVVLQHAVNNRFADRMGLGEAWKRDYGRFLDELTVLRRGY